tara:strand:+ start:370 stop:483 length:114 start_codon:yes stop_codon:yes gene_type:complete
MFDFIGKFIFVGLIYVAGSYYGFQGIKQFLTYLMGLI